VFKKIAIAAALAVIASSSFAAGATKFYAGGDVGSTKLDGFDRETSYGAFVGYNITPMFAVEAGYRRLASFDDVGADLDLNQTAISAIGSLPVGNGFGVYGRLGYNRVEVKANAGRYTASDSVNRALYGIGATYAFTPAISGRIEVQRPSSDSTNFSAGVSFQF
jgi:OOP family OmpA-OmpF porin